MPMTARALGLSGVVCGDRPAVRRTVTGLLARCGFDVAGEVDSFAGLQDAVRASRPTVAVITLPLAGMNGLAAVRALRTQDPDCEIVLLPPFDRLSVEAVAAGARALVAEDDPRALRTILNSIAATIAARQAGVALPDPRPQPTGLPVVDLAADSETAGTVSTNSLS